MPFVLILSLCLAGCLTPVDVMPLVQAHLVFFATSAMLWAIGRCVTALVPKASAGGVWRLFRRTLPWHPVAAGAWIGYAFPHLLPAEFGTGRMASAIYFGAAGVLATYGHAVFREWVKHRPQ